MKFWPWLLLLTVLLGGDSLLRRLCPRLWERVRLFWDILCALLCALYAGTLVLGAGQVLLSKVETEEKVLFCLFTGVCVAVLAWSTFESWKRCLARFRRPRCRKQLKK